MVTGPVAVAFKNSVKARLLYSFRPPRTVNRVPSDSTHPGTPGQGFLHRLGKLTAIHSADLAKTSVVLVVNTLAAAVLGFLFWLLAARTHQPSALGAAAAVLTLLPWVASLAGMGLPETVLRFFATSDHRRALVHRAMSMVLLSAVGSGVLWWSLARSSEALHEVSRSWWLFLVLPLAVVVVALNSLSTATLVASRRSHLVLFETLAAGVLRLVLVPITAGLGSLGMVLSTVSASVVSCLVSLSLSHMVIRSTPRSTGFVFGAETRRFAATNWATSVASLAPRAVVVSIVSWRAGVEAAAWVAVPLMVYPLLVLIPSASSRALNAEASVSPSEFPSLARQMLQSSLLATASLALLTAVFGPFLLGLFGVNYAQESTMLLRLLALSALCSVPNYLLDATLNIRKDTVGFFCTNVIGMILVLVSITIGSGFGPPGIGFGWVVGQLCYTVVGVKMVFRSRDRFWSTDVKAAASAYQFLRNVSQNDSSFQAARPIAPSTALSGLPDFVVILTYGRTGSTVLQAILNAFPNVVVRGENMNLPAFLFKAHAASVRTRSHATPVPLPSNDPWFGAEKVDPDRLLISARRMLIEDVIVPDLGVVLAGFKEVRNTPDHFSSFEEFAAYAGFLASVLPGVRFVLNVRDPEATSKSGWWVSDSSAAAKLQTSRDWLLRLPASGIHGLPSSRFLVLEYEKWSADPEELVPLLRFLGLPEDQALVCKILGRRLSHMRDID